MSRSWSGNSKKVYDELDPRLQVIVTRIRDEVADISLISGHRDEQEQNSYHDAGVTKVRWPDSKHNSSPSLAVDLQPYPYPQYEPKLWGALGYIAGRAHSIAAEEGHKIRWGGNWDGDGDITNQTFDDLFHIELMM